MTHVIAGTAVDVLRAELRDWIEAAWDPELTVGEWWCRIADAGWAVPSWPQEWGGRGADRRAEAAVIGEFLAAGKPGPPGGVGITHAAPTILVHGNDAQRKRYLHATASGQMGWCQLFSEPEAGSDLAGLQTRAVRDGDELVVTGQKVWTTLGHLADHAMLLARTDPTVPKHQGISWIVLDMEAPGVEVRPLRQMNGHEEFNEVFLDEVRVPVEDVVGPMHGGWALALTTLAYERASHQRFAAPGDPGPKSGILDRRAGDFVTEPAGERAARTKRRGSRVIPLARHHRRTDDPVVRQGLARLHTLNQIGRWDVERSKGAAARGSAAHAAPMGRKINAYDAGSLAGGLALQVMGPYGMLAADEPAAREGRAMIDVFLTAPSFAIAGGTNDILRNQIAEKVLDLPREARTDVDVPFDQVATSRRRGSGS